MTERIIGIGIDPGKSKSGARVVRSELRFIGQDATKAQKDLNQLGRGASSAFDKAGLSAKSASKGVEQFDRATTKAGRSTTSLTGTLTRFAAGFVSVAAAARLVTSSINQALDFSKAIGEVGTLGANMDATAAKAREFAKAFGTDAQLQVKAFYQTFSAGAATMAEASTTLEAANKLAVGGATDVETAVDGLTSVLNAYGEAAGSATDVSDTMFIAMKAGKTTIGELSGALGRVTPLAAAMGVEFDEVAAAVAALTKGGITTRMAVTSLQQVLANIVKPAKQAADEAARLGIEFNATALEAQGFQKFMAGVIQASGGSSESLAQLFGPVEALGAVMALSGQAGEDFSTILDDMENKAGATDQAFKTMSDRVEFQWAQNIAKAKDIGITFGNALLTVVVPAMSALVDNIDLVISGLSSLSAFWAVSKILTWTGAITAASVAAGGFAAALSAIAWPVAAAVATAAAIVSIKTAYNDAEEKARIYKDLQTQVNEALGITETAATETAAAIQKKSISDLKAAQSLLKLNQALLLNAKAMQFSPGGQSELASVQEARMKSIVDLQRKVIEAEGAVQDLFLIIKEGAELSAVSVDKVKTEIDMIGVRARAAKGEVQNLDQTIQGMRDKVVTIEVVTVPVAGGGGETTDITVRRGTTVSAPTTSGFQTDIFGNLVDPNPNIFATGGIANSPSIFGEAGPEAAVPLPDGRTIPVTISGAGTLGAIEVNTARTAEFLERSLGFLEAIDSDIVSMINEMQRARTVSLGGGSSGSFGDATSGIRARGDDPLRDAFFGLPIGGPTGAGAGLQSPGPIKKIVYSGDQILSVEYENGMKFAEGGFIPPSGSGSTDTRAMTIVTRPDESIAIQTPKQRKDMVTNFDHQFERGKKAGSRTINFGDININIERGDRRSAQAAADEFTQRVRANLSGLHGDQ